MRGILNAKIGVRLLVALAFVPLISAWFILRRDVYLDGDMSYCGHVLGVAVRGVSDHGGEPDPNAPAFSRECLATARPDGYLAAGLIVLSGGLLAADYALRRQQRAGAAAR